MPPPGSLQSAVEIRVVEKAVRNLLIVRVRQRQGRGVAACGKELPEGRSAVSILLRGTAKPRVGVPRKAILGAAADPFLHSSHFGIRMDNHMDTLPLPLGLVCIDCAGVAKLGLR